MPDILFELKHNLVIQSEAFRYKVMNIMRRKFIIPCHDYLGLTDTKINNNCIITKQMITYKNICKCILYIQYNNKIARY